MHGSENHRSNHQPTHKRENGKELHTQVTLSEISFRVHKLPLSCKCVRAVLLLTNGNGNSSTIVDKSSNALHSEQCHTTIMENDSAVSMLNVSTAFVFLFSLSIFLPNSIHHLDVFHLQYSYNFRPTFSIHIFLVRRSLLFPFHGVASQSTVIQYFQCTAAHRQSPTPLRHSIHRHLAVMRAIRQIHICTKTHIGR